MQFYNYFGDEVAFYEGMKLCRFLVKFSELEGERKAHEQTRKELQELEEELLRVSQLALPSLSAISPTIKKHIESSKRRRGDETK